MLPPDRLLFPVTLAGERTVVVAVPLSLPGFPSGVLEVAVAVLVRVEPAETVGATATVRVKTALPTANEGFEQVTVPVSPPAGVLQLQPPGVDSGSTKVVPGGNVSLHEVLAAGSGPLLVTVIVYVRLDPVLTGSGESTLVTDRSAMANAA